MCRICDALGQRVESDGSITTGLPKSGEDPIEAFANSEGIYGEFGPLAGPPKIGRNAPCPCGSGKKYKKCCGR